MSVKSEKSYAGPVINYLPLIIMVVVGLIAAYVLQKRMGMFEWKSWLGIFMGLFFLKLAMFKFFDLSGFAHAFSHFDLPTRYFKPYANLYPFIELALGLWYLSHWMPILLNVITIIIMAVTFVGVIQGVMKKKEVSTGGSVVKIPLSTVTIVETLCMGILAIILLI